MRYRNPNKIPTSTSAQELLLRAGHQRECVSRREARRGETREKSLPVNGRGASGRAYFFPPLVKIRQRRPRCVEERSTRGSRRSDNNWRHAMRSRLRFMDTRPNKSTRSESIKIYHTLTGKAVKLEQFFSKIMCFLGAKVSWRRN